MKYAAVDGAGPAGQFHATEMNNIILAIQHGCGVELDTLNLTVTGSDMIVTVPAFVAVVPDGSGSFVLIDHAGGNVTISASDPTDPRVDIVVLDSAGSLAATAGTPTAETGAVVEAPMPALASDEILIAKVKVENGVSTIGTDKVYGRAVKADIYGPRLLQGWVADDATTVSLDAGGSNNLPVGTYVDIPFLDVTEAFDAGTTNDVRVGYTADEDAFGTLTDVSTVGVKSMTSGAEHGYVATARAVVGYYVQTGGAATAGKAVISLPYHFCPPIVS